MGLLDDKVAVITGGNSGIGEVTGRVFAKQGAKVILMARREEQGNAVADSIRNDGGIASFIRCDVRDPKSIEAAIPNRPALEPPQRHGSLGADRSGDRRPVGSGPVSESIQEGDCGGTARHPTRKYWRTRQESAPSPAAARPGCLGDDSRVWTPISKTARRGSPNSGAWWN